MGFAWDAPAWEWLVELVSNDVMKSNRIGVYAIISCNVAMLVCVPRVPPR